jgi:predicted aspartyl protease
LCLAGFRYKFVTSLKLICNIVARTAVVAIAAAGFAANGPASAGPPQLASPYRHYSIKLNTLFTPAAGTTGLFLKARIDGGPALRLLLDSGAQYIVLDQRAAARSGRPTGAALELVGLGAAAKTARRMAQSSLEIGDLALRDCAVLAVDSPLMEGIDGVLPMSLFAGFLVRLDVPGKTLDLDPYPSDPPLQDGGYSPARADHCLLFLDAVLNESRAGYVLLDTGATYNAVSEAAAGAWKNQRVTCNSISLHGGTGDTEGYLLPSGVRFRFGSRIVSADPAVIVDLSAMATHHQLEVAGVLGYPALRRSVVTIDYRDSLVRIDGR